MKKTNSNKKSNIFIRFFTFFDRHVIVPVTKVIMGLLDFAKNNGKGFEKIITNRQALVIISLIFALITFFTIDGKSTALIDRSAEVLYGQKVNAIYNEESYVIEGLPDTVDVTLIGKKWDVYLAKQYPADEVTVDLKELKPGTHRVPLKYKQSISSVDYKLDPSVVTVVIYEKMSETRELSTDIIHKDNLDTKLSIDSLTLNRTNVIIKGASYKLAEVANVKALIDIDNLNKPKVGSQKLNDIPLIAYDKNGNKLDVEIVPNKVDATVKISSPSKVVPIKVIPQGELNGKAIKSIATSIDSITLYGAQESLDEINELPVEIDVAGLNSDKTYTVNLTKPTGVREISTKTVTIKVTLDEVVTKEVSGVNVNITNLDDNLKAQALQKNDSIITVIVKGSPSVVNNVEPSSIYGYIDLEGLGVGEHEVDVQVSGTDAKLQYTPRVKKIKIRISKK